MCETLGQKVEYPASDIFLSIFEKAAAGNQVGVSRVCYV